MTILFALAAALQASSPPSSTPQDERTAFCWAAVTNAAMRNAASTGRMPEGALAGALVYINGKIRGRYSDDEQLVTAMRAGAAAFGRANIEQAASGCLRELNEEMSRFTDLAVRSMGR
jgi:hypothetical protein